MIERSKLIYSAKYKYQLRERFCAPTVLRPLARAEIPGYVLLDTDGDLYISAGYAYDGPSGPTYDFECDMAGSLVHDALCQLIVEGQLPESMKPEVDQMLKILMIEDGANKLRALLYEKAVNKFGKYYLKPKQIIVIG